MPKPQPPTTIILVRHGQTPTTGKVLPGRAKGLNLSEEGTAQAKAAANQVAQFHERSIAQYEAAKRKSRNQKKGGRTSKPATVQSAGVSAVYTSPMERTRQTAAPIAKAVGLRARQKKGLLEADFGDWTGKKLSVLNKKPEWETVQRYPSGFRFPGGESFSEMQQRMVGTLQGLAEEHPGQTIVAVSHADTIKAAVAHALGTHLDLFQRIIIGPCSLTTIQYTHSGPYVHAVNVPSGHSSQ